MGLFSRKKKETRNIDQKTADFIKGVDIDTGQLSNSGVDVAWSNEAFELWYLYHFYNVITGVSRTKYGEMISDAVNKSPLYKSKKKYQYKKNDPQNYQVMNTYGSMDSAIKFAEAKHLEYLASDYANQNPCTTVYRLVLQLLGKDEKLNEELMKDVED